MARLFSVLFLLLSCVTNAQRVELDVAGGIANYQGDLQPLFFTLSGAKASGSLALKYAVTPNLFVRGGFSLGALSASDAKNRENLQARNLSFHTSIQEFHAGIEYKLFNPERIAITPYVFVGAGIFIFDPHAYTKDGENVRLQPLSTEGQGLAEYPGRKPYKLTQFCIPYGFGIKWQVNCNLNFGVAFRQAKTFTDYIDDVSSGYVNEAALRNAHGQVAVDLAWRRIEYDGTPYPAEDLAGRGNPRQGDWYYFVDFTIGLKLNDCETGKFSLGGIFKNVGNGKGLFKRGGSGGWQGNSRKSMGRKVRCPKV